MSAPAAPPSPLPPGSTVGILGGGQLGRMLAQAAARMGYRAHIFAPPGDAPATDVAASATRAAYDDAAALDAFAAAVDAVTVEFENVPADSLDRLAETVPVRPDGQVLRVAQDRLAEKSAAEASGIDVADYVPVAGGALLADVFDRFGGPAILKTTRLGYDGKGQWRLDGPADVAAAAAGLGRAVGILERVVPFDAEISVLVARDAAGHMSYFPIAQNRHENGILRTTTVPADIAEAAADRAVQIALTMTEALAVVGLLAVEMFVTADDGVLINEIAPRPHNSGHWTLDACAADQFEQTIRAVAGLPLVPPMPLCGAEMTNLIGAEAEDWARLFAEPGTIVHLYGKGEARPGRKMGHVTRLHPSAPIF